MKTHGAMDFTVMSSCIVIDFFLNNQPDALIIQILFCYKTLHVSGIFSAHRQKFSTVHSALVSLMQVSGDRFQAVGMELEQFHPDSAWKRSSENCMKLTSAECTVENS
jgi:hypothetical protein